MSRGAFVAACLLQASWPAGAMGVTAPPTRGLIDVVNWYAVAVAAALMAGLAWLGANRRPLCERLPSAAGLVAIAAAAVALSWPAAANGIGAALAPLDFLPNDVPRGPALSVVLILMGVGSLIVACRAGGRFDSTGAAPPPGGDRVGARPRELWLVCALLLVLGLAHGASVVRSMRSEEGLERLMARWLLAMAAAVALASVWDRARGPAGRGVLTRREWAAVLTVTAATVALYAWDLDSYRYAFVGDEFAFFAVARDLARGTLVWDNLLSDAGIWGYHPRLSSAYQALVMHVVGVSNFGWRLSSVLAAALCLPFCFAFLKLAVSVRAAWFGTLALGLSHYAMTFAHIGYNNNHVLFPTVACLALLAAGARRGAARPFVLSGIAAGLGFYTFYTARLAVMFAAAFFLLHLAPRPRRAWLARGGWFVLGFALAAAPALARPQRLLDNMRGQSVFAAPEGGTAACWSCVTPQQEARISRNTVLTLLSPVHLGATSHFVSGPLVDGVTAALFAVGLVCALLRATRARVFPLLASFFLLSALVLGASTPYDEPPATRVLFLVLPVCLLAGVGADRVLELLPARRQRAALILMITVMGALNLYRVHVTSPRDHGIHTQALVVRYLQGAPDGVRRYYLLPDEWGADLIVFHLELYGLQRRAEVLHFRDVVGLRGRLQTPCEALFNQDDHDRREELIAQLVREHPVATRERFTDPGGKNEMVVLRLP